MGASFPAFPFPSNPWSGTGREWLSALPPHRLGGGARLPDAPPPSAAELARWERERLAHIVEGYIARYVSARALISVSATTFDDPFLATSAPVTDLLRSARGVRDRFVTGATVIDVSASDAADCFQAIHAHIRGLM